MIPLLCSSGGSSSDHHHSTQAGGDLPLGHPLPHRPQWGGRGLAPRRCLTSRSRPAATVTMSPVSLLMVNMFWEGLCGVCVTIR